VRGGARGVGASGAALPLWARRCHGEAASLASETRFGRRKLAMEPVAPAEPRFTTISQLIAATAHEAPARRALYDGRKSLTYAELDAAMDRVAASLQRDGVAPRSAIAISALSSVEYLAVFLGALRAGIAVAPLAPSSTPASLAAMIADCDAKAVFVDASTRDLFGAAEASRPRIALDENFDAWLAPEGAKPAPVAVQPDWTFNTIYSSGTTGAPKGIDQPHFMRWQHVRRSALFGYDADAITLISTPLYSNTTLVSVLPALAGGGAIVLMKKFDAREFLRLAEAERATHAMLVPVQYSRILALPDFDAFDLKSFRMKFCTSALFAAALKREVLNRWPGGLVEFFGMTEGGGTCILIAHEHPDKLHTVGRPAEGHDVRLIDEEGREVGAGEIGEIVGHSGATMTGYHKLDQKTREAEWHEASGKRFIRTGDIGRFDADGFLTLLDRRKDMIISGGFNIYPSDLEAILRAHPQVAEASVVGAPSKAWGETPVAFVVPAAGAKLDPEELRAWANAKLGKTQRLSAVRLIDILPRSPIGKVLKRDLRDLFGSGD
jgi:acyl-CoA synthetase (AMP-forming)/AMP-acid ligase II